MMTEDTQPEPSPEIQSIKPKRRRLVKRGELNKRITRSSTTNNAKPNVAEIMKSNDTDIINNESSQSSEDTSRWDPEIAYEGIVEEDATQKSTGVEKDHLFDELDEIFGEEEDETNEKVWNHLHSLIYKT